MAPAPPSPVPRRRLAAPCPPRCTAAFTLIELLLALAIFAVVMTMAGASFWSIMKAWNRGNALLDQLHYGEFAMDQLVSALRSAAWFPSKPESYGFWLDDSGGTGPHAENVISWVTGGSAFLPPESEYRDGLHRLSVTVEGTGRKRALHVSAWPHIVEDPKDASPEEYAVAAGVSGLSCEWYDFEEESWSQDWEETNSLPKLVRLTLTMQPQGEQRDPYVLQRLVTLEVAPDLPGREKRANARHGRHGEDDAEDAGSAERRSSSSNTSDSSRPRLGSADTAKTGSSSTSRASSSRASSGTSSSGGSTLNLQRSRNGEHL